MSRRFGRNQRRRAREAQAQLQAELRKVGDTLSLTTKTAVERGHRVHALTCEIEAAKAMLPRHSALMRPEALKLGGERLATVNVDPLLTSRIDRVDRFDPSVPVEAVKFLRVPLDVLLTDVEPDDLTCKLHARVQFAGADLYYAISPDALHAMSVPDLADRLAKELARQFAPALMRELGHAGRLGGRRPMERSR